MEEKIDQLTKRHIARVLSALDEVSTPQIIKALVKKHFYFLAQDIKEQARNKEQKGDHNG